MLSIIVVVSADSVLAGFAMSGNQLVVNKSKRMLVDYIHKIIRGIKIDDYTIAYIK